MIENGWTLTLEWDRISCFQGASVLGLLAFVGLARGFDARWPRPRVSVPAAAGVAALLVAAPFLIVPGLRAALFSELERMATFAGFCRACVAEYHRLFHDGLRLPLLVYGFSFWLIPLCFVGLFFARDLSRPLRSGLAIPTVLLGLLVVDQVKLAHMFAIPWALMLPAGGAGCLDLLARTGRVPPRALPRLRQVAGLIVAALAVWHILALTFTTPPRDPRAPNPRRDVVAAIAALEFAPQNDTEAQRVAVMAPWDLGHYLLYETDKPIVASSYQRRVDGIRDSFDVLAAQSFDEARQILARRRVHFWVRPGDPSFLEQYHLVVPGRTPLARVVVQDGQRRVGLDPAVKQTFWARTATGAKLPDWLELVWESPDNTGWGGAFGGPAFRVFRVRYADERL
jgi:hypothetical protein